MHGEAVEETGTMRPGVMLLGVDRDLWNRRPAGSRLPRARNELFRRLSRGMTRFKNAPTLPARQGGGPGHGREPRRVENAITGDPLIAAHASGGLGHLLTVAQTSF
jgi:hypothetical protein